MRRFPLIMLMAATLLGACAPVVTLIRNDATATSTIEPTLAVTPAWPTQVPTPTLSPDLGIHPDALKGVEVVIWHGWDGSSADLFARMADEFTQSNEWGIKVKTTASPNLETLENQVSQVLGAPEQPDVVVALPEQLLAWQEHITDLSPYLAQPELGLAGQDGSGAFWAQSTVKGVRYGVPAARSARFLFYNLSFARDLGFDAAPKTAEDFRKQACAANAFWKKDTDLSNDRFGGLAMDETSNWQSPFSWLAAGGGTLFVDGEFHFDTPENLKALEFITGLQKDGCAWLESPAWNSTDTSNFELFASRQALFISGNLSDFAGQRQALAAATSADEWTVLPFPGTTPAIVGYGPDYAVLKSSAVRQQAAWLFIRWMLNDKNQARWSRGTGFLPVTSSAVKVLETDSSSIPQWVAAMQLIPQAIAYPQSPRWQLAQKIMADGFLAFTAGMPGTSLSDVFKIMDSTLMDLPK